MKLNTLVIDDEPIALEKLRSYVDKVPFLQLVGSCRNGLEATAMMASERIDVIFTDISMPDMSGLDFVASLAGNPLVVFITAYSNYAVDSYRLSAVDYLLKPYGFADFQKAANRVLEQYSLRHPVREHLAGDSDTGPAGGTSLFVKVDYRYVRVSLAEIRYIKGYGEYLQIYIAGEPKPLLTLSSFGAIREKLSDNFLQVHRSYIVNMDMVESINRGRIQMDADTVIPVGDSYKDAFQSYVNGRSVGSVQKKQQ